MDNCGHTICIVQGITWSKVWRWAADPLVYKDITAVPQTTPLRLTCTAHGVVNGWDIAITDLGGYAGLPNAQVWPPCEEDFLQATVIDSNTLELNAFDALRYGVYTSGGRIAYYTPVSLAGCTGLLNIYDVPAVLGQTPTPVLSVSLVLDDTAKTITATISALQSAALIKPQYSYDLTITDGAGVVTLIETGSVESRVRGT